MHWYVPLLDLTRKDIHAPHPVQCVAGRENGKRKYIHVPSHSLPI
jgi:hypothetical protein